MTFKYFNQKDEINAILHPKLPVNLNSYNIGFPLDVTEQGGRSQAGGQAAKALLTGD